VEEAFWLALTIAAVLLHGAGATLPPAIRGVFEAQGIGA
jgi:hypothetical protein